MQRNPKVKVGARIRSDYDYEIRAEAERLGESIAWVLERAWEIACKSIVRIPAREAR